MNDHISAKEKFFSKVSHDLRGSFTSILGFSDILNDPNENLTKEEISEYVSRIGKQSRESFDLLVNFINWLKLEDYRYGLTSEVLEINEVIREIIQHHKKGFNGKNIKVDLESSNSDKVSMDYEILQAILNNTFLFLLKTCCENSELKITVKHITQKLVSIKFVSECSENQSTFLQNIDLRDLSNDLSFPIIFAIKFTELSGGEFQFNYEKNEISVELKLPQS